MRCIIYGVGAIGGTLAAKLAQSGASVAGIARGAQLEALKQNRILLRTPSGEFRTRFPVVADPAELPLGPDDIVFLCMKSQDTTAALQRLLAAGATTQPIVCAQNGVANEREALRFFPNIYAMMVVLPATFLVPGEVAAFGMPHAGLFDLGRYPAGSDSTADAIVAAHTAAGFADFKTPTAMVSKYGKLLMNLGNVLDAAAGDAIAGSPLLEAARAEGQTVLRAAGIAFGAGGDDPRRKTLMSAQPIPDTPRIGSSSAQSLARDTGSIETDYLNGEIVLLGRLHGVPAPVNTALCALGRRLVAERVKPGSLSVAEIEAFVAAR